jgi:hypothetical protein
MLPFRSSYYLERIYTLGAILQAKGTFEDVAQRLANVLQHRRSG